MGFQLDMRPGARVLDWGCGCGHTSSWLVQTFGARVVGVDIVPSAIAFANFANDPAAGRFLGCAIPMSPTPGTGGAAHHGLVGTH